MIYMQHVHYIVHYVVLDCALFVRYVVHYVGYLGDNSCTQADLIYIQPRMQQVCLTQRVSSHSPQSLNSWN